MGGERPPPPHPGKAATWSAPSRLTASGSPQQASDLHVYMNHCSFQPGPANSAQSSYSPCTVRSRPRV